MYQMKAKDPLLFDNIITQYPVLARRAWFWFVASVVTNSLINFPLIVIKIVSSVIQNVT